MRKQNLLQLRSSRDGGPEELPKLPAFLLALHAFYGKEKNDGIGKQLVVGEFSPNRFLHQLTILYSSLGTSAMLYRLFHYASSASA